MANKKAFTLIELLVVVLIIGILSSIALPQYTQAVEKARATEAVSNIASFKKAVEAWKLANPGEYKIFTGASSNVGQLDIGIPANWVQATRAMTSSSEYSKSCSKNFCYEISTDHVKAYRANSSTYKYGIDYAVYNKSYHCYAYSPADLKICNSLSNMTYVNESF